MISTADLPDWITRTFLLHAGTTPLIGLPSILAEWADANGIPQQEGEPESLTHAHPGVRRDGELGGVWLPEHER